VVSLRFTLVLAFILVGGIAKTNSRRMSFLMAALPGFVVAFVTIRVKEPVAAPTPRAKRLAPCGGRQLALRRRPVCVFLA